MTMAAPIPALVRRIVPTLGSSTDGEALGACRAIGRTLKAVGLDFHHLAAAIPTGETVDNIHELRRPTWNDATWDAVRPRRPRAYTFTPTQSAEHRRMALYCRNNDRGRLSDREREFIGDISRKRRELTIPQADWLSVICDRLAMEARRA